MKNTEFAQFIKISETSETASVILHQLRHRYELHKRYSHETTPETLDEDEAIFQDLCNTESLSLQRTSSNDNPVVDLSLLQFAKNLKWLALGRNEISDIRPLAGLRQLTTLYLGNNKIQDITPLEHLSQLTELHLSGNPIKNFYPLKALSHLTKIYFEGEHVFFTMYPHDEKYLKSALHLPDLRCFPYLENLRELHLDRIQLDSQSLDGIEQFPQLRNLSAKTCGIASLGTLKQCQQLTSLDLWDNKITDISALNELKNLRYVNLSENPLKSIAPLKALPNLHEFHIDISDGESGEKRNPFPKESRRLRKALTGWEAEFIENSSQKTPSMTLIVDDNQWKTLHDIPFNVDDYDGDRFLLSAEHRFLLEDIEKALQKKITQKEFEYVYFPYDGWSESRSCSILLEEGGRLPNKVRKIVQSIQEVLCTYQREWNVFLETDTAIDDDVDFNIWILHDRIVVRREDETTIRKLFTKRFWYERFFNNL